MTLRFGYGTNGFADHRIDDVLVILADLGFAGVSLTLDHQHLDPYASDLSARVRRVRRRLDLLGLGVVVETGARYLLDPRRKHQPTLLSDDPTLRVDLLVRAVRIAADLGAAVVHLWSGVGPDNLTDQQAWDRLAAACEPVVAAADKYGVRLGFEPEPGMFIDTLDRYAELVARLGHPQPALGLTLDIGHCRCLEQKPETECVRAVADRLVHVQIEDMRRGVHEHLEFGAGEMEFPPILEALTQIRYDGLVSVELPRHSHAAPAVAARSIDFLRKAAP